MAGLAPEPPEPAEPLSPGSVALWLGLSALTCTGMLAATTHLAAEIGSNPIAWVGPFGLYLFSFMVTFSGRWQRWMTIAATIALAISLSAYMAYKGFRGVTVNHYTAWWLLALTASGSFVGNALLHSVRPAQRFERFYLVLAAGGVIGGLLSSTIIPYVINRPVEFTLVSAVLLATGLIWLTARRVTGAAVVIACLVIVPVLGVGIAQAHRESELFGTMRHYRDLYGHILVQPDSRSGSQLTMNDAARRRPTLYFTESSGGGRTLERLQAVRPEMRVGVIGLGAGTLAAYARRGDTYDFWDIDPKSIRVAKEHFTFVAEAAGKINLIRRDGRKALEESRENYDVLVLDAFTGDGVPSHLLTREAMAIYMRRLSTKNGLLLVHCSSRYSRYFPVIEATARSLNFTAVDVHTEIKRDVTEPGKERDWDPTPTEYVIITKPEQAKDVASWFLDEEDNGRVKHTVNTLTSPLVHYDLIWSDDRNADIDVLNLGRFLFEN